MSIHARKLGYFGALLAVAVIPVGCSDNSTKDSANGGAAGAISANHAGAAGQVPSAAIAGGGGQSIVAGSASAGKAGAIQLSAGAGGEMLLAGAAGEAGRGGPNTALGGVAGTALAGGGKAIAGSDPGGTAGMAGTSGNANGGRGGVSSTISSNAGSGIGGVGGAIPSNAGSAGLGGGDVGTTPLSPDDGRGNGGPLVVQVNAARAPAVPGRLQLYTITVGNTSQVAVDGISVLLRLPEGLNFYYTNATPDSSNCGNGTCSPNEEATWTIGTLPPGSTQTIVVNMGVLSTVGNGSTVAPVVRVNATGVNPILITKTLPVSVSSQAELSFDASADPVVPGQTMEMTLDLGQIGNATLVQGRLQLSLPGGLTPIQISDGGVESSPGVITWPAADISVGLSLHRKLTLAVSPNARAGDVLNPRATFTYDGATVAYTAQTAISVVAPGQPLLFNVTAVRNPGSPTSLELYRATITNTALRQVDGINLTLQIPDGLTYYYTDQAEPDSSSCGNGSCTAGEEATWSLGSLAPGASTTVDINPNLVASVAVDGSVVTLPFLLRATNVNPINLLKSVPVYSKTGAQLALGTNAGPTGPNQTFTYDLDVGQIGPSTLQSSTLHAYLPAGLHVTAASDSGDTSTAGMVVWNLGNITVGSSLHRTFTVAVDDKITTPVNLLTRATLTYDSGLDLDASSEDVVSVLPAALPLTASLDANVQVAQAGTRILYTTTITNNSQRIVDGVGLLLRVPGSISYYFTTDADPDSSGCGNGSCTAGEEGSWNLGSLSPGDIKIVTVNALLASDVTGGSLVTLTERLTGANLGGVIQLQKTVRTRN